jgi:hypothetical protein
MIKKIYAIMLMCGLNFPNKVIFKSSQILLEII